MAEIKKNCIKCNITYWTRSNGYVEKVYQECNQCLVTLFCYVSSGNYLFLVSIYKCAKCCWVDDMFHFRYFLFYEDFLFVMRNHIYQLSFVVVFREWHSCLDPDKAYWYQTSLLECSKDFEPLRCYLLMFVVAVVLSVRVDWLASSPRDHNHHCNNSQCIL